jgi:transmembrane sensor
MKTPIQVNDELLISYLLDEVTGEQARQITEWRTAHAANERRFEQFRLIWDSSKNFKADAGIDAHASLQKVKQRAAKQKKTQKVLNMWANYGWLKMAAAILFFAGCAWLYFNRFANPQVQFETQTIVKTNTLPDGSIITLNKYSLLSHPKKFSSKQRDVELIKGEAFFKVAPDKAKPFIITAGKATIRVVGTSFNVNFKNGNIEVIVETGIVQVSLNGKMISLKPGEMVSVQKGTAILLKQANHDNLYNYYYSKEFVANNVSLSKLVKVLNEAYDSHIVIGRKDLNDKRIVVILKTNLSLNEILNLLSLTFNLEVEKKQNQIVLK